MKAPTLAIVLTFFAAPIGILSAHCPAHQIADAQTQAAQEKKSVLLVFIGGEWSEPSQKFREEILNNADLKKKADEAFVVQLLEYPKDQTKTDQTLKDLREKFQVGRFPTLLLTDPLGRPFGYTGYRQGGSEALVKALSDAVELRKKRDASFAKAQKAKGIEKAKALVEGLNLLPRQILTEHYSAELAAIKKADPKNETKLFGELEKAEVVRKEQDEYNLLFREKKYDEIVKKSQAEAAKAKGEDAQRLTMFGIQALVSLKKYNEANQSIEEMGKLAPESQFGKSVDRYKKTVAGIKKRNEAPKKPAKAAKPRGPIVSKPVAVVSDIKILEKELTELNANLKSLSKKSFEVAASEAASSKRISELERELKALRETHKKQSEVAKKSREEQLRLTKKSKLLAEVIENHHAMEKRKNEISGREEKAEEPKKKAEAPRNKAKKVKSGK